MSIHSLHFNDPLKAPDQSHPASQSIGGGGGRSSSGFGDQKEVVEMTGNGDVSAGGGLVMNFSVDSKLHSQRCIFMIIFLGL